MMKEIRARYSNGVIEPLEDVGLEEGEEILVLVRKESVSDPKKTIKALRDTAGAWIGTHDPEELKRNIYADRLISTRPEPKL